MVFRADVLLDSCAACLHEVKLNNSPHHVLICIYTHMSKSMLQKYMQKSHWKAFLYSGMIFAYAKIAEVDHSLS